MDAPLHHFIAQTARDAISLGWRPAASRPFVRRAADERQQLIDSSVWDAMRQLLAEQERLPGRR